MKHPAQRIILSIEGNRLAVVHTETSKTGQVSLRSSVRKSLPSLTEDSVSDASRAIRKALDEARIPKSGICIALPRQEVIIKQLSISCGELEDSDLMPMVRMKLGREGTIDVSTVELDYTVLSRSEQTAQVLVGAIEQVRLSRLRALLSGTGRKITSIRIRTDGLASYSESRSPTLVIAPGPSGCEFAVVEDGRSVYSRSTQDGITPKQIRIEADRTIISSSRSDPNLPLTEPILVSSSSDEFPEQWVHAQSPPSHPDLGRGLQNIHLALVGLATEEPGSHRIDFQRPQKPADRSAPARQRALLVALVLLAMIGTSWVLGQQETKRLEGEIKLADATRKQAFNDYLDSLVAQARLDHETAWVSSTIDWAAHLERLIATLPEPGSIILDEITAKSESQIEFLQGEKAPLPGTWTQTQRIRFDISGTADSRSTIEQLRESLLAIEGTRLVTNGADTDDEFSLELLTEIASPREREQ